MEGLKPALAASAGLHLAVLVALSVAPIRLEAPPSPGDAIIPIEIVSLGPSRPPASDAAFADSDPAEAAPERSAATSVTDPVEAAASARPQAVENPPLPVPKPRRRLRAPEPPPEPPAPREPATVVETKAPTATEEIAPHQAVGAGPAAAVDTGSPWGAERGGPTAGSAEPSPGTGSEALEAYFAQLQRWLEKHKRYPRMAQVRGQEGTGMLRFTVDRNGRVLSHRLQDGTGHAALDREIEAMIERAQPLPPIPQDLPQPTLDLAIPVTFRLR